MRYHRSIGLAILAIIISLAVQSQVSSQVTAPGVRSLMDPGSINFETLANANRNELQSELNKASAYRVSLESKMLAIAKGSSSKQESLAAIYFMGYYRMRECASPLSGMIKYRDEGMGGETGHLPLWSEWPVADALIRIGMPSVPDMISNLRRSDDDVTRRLSVVVLRSILGPDLAVHPNDDEILKVKAVHNQQDAERLSRAKGMILDSRKSALP